MFEVDKMKHPKKQVTKMDCDDQNDKYTHTITKPS